MKKGGLLEKCGVGGKGGGIYACLIVVSLNVEGTNAII